MRLAPVFVTAAALALAACNSGSEPTPAATDGAASDVATADPTGTAAPAPAETAMPTEIPAAFQGRFGLVSADCTGPASDAKGLMEVSADKLKFYESSGKLDAITQATEGRIKGNFSYKGEGMEWKREEVLDLRDGGKVLVRREFGEDASPTPFNYTRCE